MFYIGIYFGKNTNPAASVIFKKIFRNARKHYLVREIKAQDLPEDIEKTSYKIDALRHDRKYIKTKRVFSQDRRPSKIVLAPPIVVTGTEADLSRIDQLRERKIPVENIALQNETGWGKKEGSIIGMGDNYIVGRSDVMDCLAQVYDQHRLLVETDITFGREMNKALDSCSEQYHNKNGHSRLWDLPDDFKNILLSLAMPVWFCEKIRIIRRY